MADVDVELTLRGVRAKTMGGDTTRGRRYKDGRD
jgi:hypothetical protein